ncbi:MAG: hypothetical protein ABTQ34_09140 [Bdellovibrionales bacterium]
MMRCILPLIFSQDEKVIKQIATNHHLVGAALNSIEISQPRVEIIASSINFARIIGDPLHSRNEKIARYRDTPPKQVAEAIRGFCRSPAFLDVRGHHDALSSVPSIDTINSWRGKGPIRNDLTAVSVSSALSNPHP